NDIVDSIENEPAFNREFIASDGADTANVADTTKAGVTRTQLGSDKYSIEWLVGDEVSIFAVNGTNTLNTSSKFVTTQAGNPTLLSGSVPNANRYVGLHPYSSSATYTPSTRQFSTTLPTIQKAVDNNIHPQMNLAVAESNAADNHRYLYFKNAVSLFRVKFALGAGFESKVIKKILLVSNQDAAGNAANLSGNYAITLPTNTTDPLTTATGSNAVSYAELAKEDGSALGAGNEYYFMLPPQALASGFTMVFMAEDGEVCVKNVTSNVNFTISKINQFSVALKKFEKKLITNLPLIKYIELTNKISFTKEADGTVDIYKNYALINNVTKVPGNTASDLVSLSDIEHFTNLTEFGINSAANLTGTADFTQNKKLTRVIIKSAKLSSIDVSNLANLTTLSVTSSALTGATLTNASKLTSVDFTSNSLTTLDTSTQPELTQLVLRNNKVSSLDLSNNTKLVNLDLTSNQLTALNVAQNTVLTSLQVRKNKLTSIDVTSNTQLELLDLSDNAITALDVTHNTLLLNLSFQRNNIASVDVTKNTLLTVLNAGNNPLISIDLSKNTELTTLSVNSTDIATLDLKQNAKLVTMNGNSMKLLTNIDISTCTSLSMLRLQQAMKLTSIDVSKNAALTVLQLDGGVLETLDISMLPKLMVTNGTELYCGNQYAGGKTMTLTLTSTQQSNFASFITKGDIATDYNTNVAYNVK
ncbi:MAG: hypothetical protein SO013_09325, partial [Prevotella sp.]|nr:hypothetical protein [Prevotella sp.]